MNNSHNSPSRLRASVLIYYILTSILSVLTGTILYAFGRLPSATIGFAIGTLILAVIIGTVCVIVVSGAMIIGKSVISDKIPWGIIAIFIISIGIASSIGLLGKFDQTEPLRTSYPGVIQQGVPQPTPTTTVLVRSLWRPLLFQSSPFCDNDIGTVWSVHLQGTSLSCSDSGLVMQQASASPYAQLDLDRVSGSTYDQSSFRVSVQVVFKNPHDTGTWAALIVQTPQEPGITGGYLFMLNPAGEWQLRFVESASSIRTTQHGLANIDPSQSVTMTIVVQDHMLQGSVDDQRVVSSSDALTPAHGAVGLLVAHPRGGNPSSPIIYSDFRLDRFVRLTKIAGVITKNLQLTCSDGCEQPRVITVLTTIIIDQNKGRMTFNFRFTNGTSEDVILQPAIHFDSYPGESQPLLAKAGKSMTGSITFDFLPYSGVSYTLEVNIMGPEWDNFYQPVELTF